MATFVYDSAKTFISPATAAFSSQTVAGESCLRYDLPGAEWDQDFNCTALTIRLLSPTGWNPALSVTLDGVTSTVNVTGADATWQTITLFTGASAANHNVKVKFPSGFEGNIYISTDATNKTFGVTGSAATYAAPTVSPFPQVSYIASGSTTMRQEGAWKNLTYGTGIALSTDYVDALVRVNVPVSTTGSLRIWTLGNGARYLLEKVNTDGTFTAVARVNAANDSKWNWLTLGSVTNDPSNVLEYVISVIDNNAASGNIYAVAITGTGSVLGSQPAAKSKCLVSFGDSLTKAVLGTGLVNNVAGNGDSSMGYCRRLAKAKGWEAWTLGVNGQALHSAGINRLTAAAGVDNGLHLTNIGAYIFALVTNDMTGGVLAADFQTDMATAVTTLNGAANLQNVPTVYMGVMDRRDVASGTRITWSGYVQTARNNTPKSWSRYQDMVGVHDTSAASADFPNVADGFSAADDVHFTHPTLTAPGYGKIVTVLQPDLLLAAGISNMKRTLLATRQLIRR